MSYSYGRYTRPDGDEVLLPADTLTRGAYERKGFKYVGPATSTPGLEPANVPVGEGVVNFSRDNLTVEEREGGTGPSGLDAESIVQQATDVVSRKIAGTWTEAEAAAESILIRNTMAEHGSFPLAELDQAGQSAQAMTGPFPTPVEPQPGGEVSVTGSGEGPGAAGVSTDGANGAGGAVDLSGAQASTTNTTTAGSPGSFSGDTPTVKAELEATTPSPSTPWTEGQYVRVGNYDWYWNGSAWTQGRAPAAAPTGA